MQVGAGTQEWTTYDYDKEKNLIYKRSSTGDKYPEGVDRCLALIEKACAEGKAVKVIAVKTFPKWTWYLKIVE